MANDSEKYSLQTPAINSLWAKWMGLSPGQA